MKRGFQILLILALLIAACDTEDDQPVGESIFKGGNQGLVATFEQFGVLEEGKAVVFDTETFPIEVKLQNKGEHDVVSGDVRVKIKGINLEDFTGITADNLTNQQKIEKVSDFNDQGGYEMIDFTPTTDAKYKLNVTGFFTPNIVAEVNYRYKTRAIIPQVCFKEDATDPNLCNIKEQKTVFVSGAPVIITSVEQDIAGRGIISLAINLENVGGGRVTLSGSEITRTDQLAFNVLTETDSWECRSTGRENEARFVDGKAKIICRLKQPLPAKALFTKQVEIELEYDYQITIQESVKIKESLS